MRKTPTDSFGLAPQPDSIGGMEQSSAGGPRTSLRAGTTWCIPLPTAKSSFMISLTLSTNFFPITDTGDFFGVSVAVSGNTMVIGAYGEDSNATGVNGNQNDNSASGSGAAYVFVRSNGVWSQQSYLKASNTEGGDQFGFAVAISGDTVVIGAPNEASNATGVNGNQSDNSAPGAGAVYVFT